MLSSIREEGRSGDVHVRTATTEGGQTWNQAMVHHEYDPLPWIYSLSTGGTVNDGVREVEGDSSSEERADSECGSSRDTKASVVKSSMTMSEAYARNAKDVMSVNCSVAS